MHIASSFKSKFLRCLFFLIFFAFAHFSLLFAQSDKPVEVPVEVKTELKTENEAETEIEAEVAQVLSDDFSILLTGDILIAENMFDFMEIFGDYYPIRQISPFLTYFDYVFANLETPITTHTEPMGRKPYIFKISPEEAGMIAQLKIDIVSIANNHIMDYNEEGLRSTIEWLEEHNIKYAGAGSNLEEARKPAVFMHNDTEIVFLAYNERPPHYFAATENFPGAAPFDLKMITEDIKKHKTKTNLVLVSLHWGIEQTLYPTKKQRAAAKQIIDAGADCIIGHHPHWPQGIEIYKDAPIIYSLGNFLNGYYNIVEHDNIFVVLNCEKAKIVSLDIIPISGRNSKINFQPYQLTGKKGADHLKLIQRISKPFGTKITIDKDIGRIIINPNKTTKTKK